MMKTISILNDVLGPIMTGPSSSHTAAPGKIGLAVRKLWGRDIARALVVYDSAGSYPSTHIGQGSDFGFTGGLLGMAADHPDFWNSLDLAEKKGLDIRFEIRPLSAGHPNEARIDVYEDNSLSSGPAAVMSVLSYSTGGGTFLLSEMDGFAIENDGHRGHFYVCISEKNVPDLRQKLHAAGARYRLLCRTRAVTGDIARLPENALLADIELQSLLRTELIDEIFKIDGLIYLRTLPAIGIAEQRQKAVPPFITAAEAAEYAGTNPSATMAELAIDYEAGLCTETRAVLLKRMDVILSAMRQSMTPPPKNWPISTCIVPKMSRSLMARESLKSTNCQNDLTHEKKPDAPAENLLDLGILNGAMSAAAAVMENSCVHRIVVAAPTAGSCGVIPAAVIKLGENLGCEDAKILDALWAAGLVGAFIANEATFGAEIAGCQAEIGSAAAMAAAGIVELRGGTVLQGFHAAAIAMQSLMGLICDPVAGLTEFPCIERNITAAGVAVISANMALCGMTSPVSLDETILTMLEVGKLLPKELRCTCEGGLCMTRTGQNLAREVEKGQCSKKQPSS